METRHIRMDYEEALNAKKQLLTSEINLLHIAKKIKNYKLLRKKEIATKNKLKTSLTSLKSKITMLQSSFPNETQPKSDFKKTKKQAKKTKKHKNKKTVCFSVLQFFCFSVNKAKNCQLLIVLTNLNLHICPLTTLLLIGK